MLLLGDSVGFGVGCILGHDAEEAGHNCPVQPDFSAWNGYVGACSVSEGLVLLYNQTAIEGNCNGPNHYQTFWRDAVDVVTPDVVVIVTGGWEIVNRWDEDNFPSGLNCSPTSVLNCPAPDRQMGNDDDTLEANAINNYKTEMANAINLIRSRPSQPKVLLLNMPYVDPDIPEHGGGIWFESYDATEPANWDSPNAATPYAPSKTKVERLNQAVLDVKATTFGSDPNVEVFDFWTIFSPEVTAGGERVFSMYVCDADPSLPLDQCTDPIDQRVVRLSDRGHLVQAGNALLGETLLPKVREMLGIGP